MDFLHRVAGLIGAHVGGIRHVLGGARHRFRAHFAGGQAERRDVEQLRQHEQFPAVHIRLLANRAYAKEVRQHHALHAGVNRADVRGMEGKLQRL